MQYEEFHYDVGLVGWAESSAGNGAGYITH